MQSLEDLLNGSGTAAQANAAPQAEVTEQPAPPEPEAEEQSQEVAEPATGENGADASHAAPPAATVDEPLDKKIAAFQRKAEDETRKRQDYEKQLAEVRRQAEEQARYIQQVQEWYRNQQQQEPEVDLYDPQQAQQFFNNQLQPINRQIYETRVLLSQEMYRSAHPDYQEMEDIFAEAMNQDPSLRQKLEAHPVPAKFAYEEGKRLKLQQELSDPDAYRAKLRDEILAEIQSQQQPASQQAPTQSRPVPQPPKSLAGVPSAARDPIKHPWKGPTPLEQLLG